MQGSHNTLLHWTDLQSLLHFYPSREEDFTRLLLFHVKKIEIDKSVAWSRERKLVSEWPFNVLKTATFACWEKKIRIHGMKLKFIDSSSMADIMLKGKHGRR